MEITGKKKLPSLYVVGTIAFIATYIVTRGLLEAVEMPAGLRVVVALLPVPAFALFLTGFIRNIRESDELERRIHLEALALAFPITLIFIFTLGLLELAIPLSKDDWSYRHVGFMIPVFYFGALALARRRYS